jgi:hypothetical protein
MVEAVSVAVDAGATESNGTPLHVDGRFQQFLPVEPDNSDRRELDWAGLLRAGLCFGSRGCRSDGEF